MKAVGLTRYLPIEQVDSLLDLELPMPKAIGRDLLVKIEAVAVNPIDTKVRKPKDKVETTPKVLGWDAAGVVIETGSEASLFKIGDKVFYAGELNRNGTNAEYQLVDERLVGHAPQTISVEEAAALPLTSVTAWESLFNRLRIAEDPAKNHDKTLLVIGGAGGVGSIAIQLAKKLAGIHVIATASRPETIEWVTNLGADTVINHRHDLRPQLEAQNIPQVDYILCNSNTDDYYQVMVDLIKPQGSICALVDAAKPVDITLLKGKSANFVWESMFTRSSFKTADMVEQHNILERISTLIDHGTLQTTVNEVKSPINAANLRAAHAQLESGTTIGKIVLSGWS